VLLFPRLPHPAAVQLTDSLRRMPIPEAAAAARDEHPAAIFTSTGGARATARQLQEIRVSLSDCAKGFGYPGPANDDQKGNFDAAAAAILHSKMALPAGEATKAGVWEFMCCVLLPDLVRWRFPGGPDGTSPDRFLSGRRNAFERLWWRAYLLHSPDQGGSPYSLLDQLGEDELVQILERPSIAAIRPLTKHVAVEFLRAAARYPQIARRTLIREAQKRLMRLSAFVSYDALEDEQLCDAVRAVFGEVHASITTTLRQPGQKAEEDNDDDASVADTGEQPQAVSEQQDTSLTVRSMNGLSKEGADVREVTLRFRREKETKNTVVFTEEERSGQPFVIRTLYLQKWFAGDAEAVSVTVAVEAS
jgi:hypothetical protein